MSKKTTSTSRASVIPIRKTGGKAKGPRKGKTKADVDQATIPIKTPAPDAVETPAPITATAKAPAALEAPTDGTAVEGVIAAEPTAGVQAPTAETPLTPKGK